MSKCAFQRARSPEQKAERRAQIINAAAAFFANERFETISLAAIARQAGVTKAALYRYFPSKEALFLSLYLHQLDAVIEADLQLQTSLADTLTEVLLEHPLFCHLTAILHTVLEQNLDVEQARAFKLDLLERMSALTSRLVTDFRLPADRAMRFLLQVQQALIGCWAISHPSAAVAQVLEEPPLSVFKVDFGDALRDQLKALEGSYEGGVS